MARFSFVKSYQRSLHMSSQPETSQLTVVFFHLFRRSGLTSARSFLSLSPCGLTEGQAETIAYSIGYPIGVSLSLFGTKAVSLKSTCPTRARCDRKIVITEESKRFLVHVGRRSGVSTLGPSWGLNPLGLFHGLRYQRQRGYVCLCCADQDQHP